MKKKKKKKEVRGGQAENPASTQRVDLGRKGKGGEERGEREGPSGEKEIYVRPVRLQDVGPDESNWRKNRRGAVGDDGGEGPQTSLTLKTQQKNNEGDEVKRGLPGEKKRPSWKRRRSRI